MHFDTINSTSSLVSFETENHSKKFNMQCMQQFLERDYNSRLTSGRKEAVSRGGKKQQIRYLNFSTQILHEKYLSENPNVQIGKSRFYSCLRKLLHLKSPTVNLRDQCLCKQCTNMQVRKSFPPEKSLFW